ncbi:MAG TPA: chemotaxis protein CheB [Rhodanobacter sp.]|nr:chemotaxis protein CheB [Rhodanobacter sp.]
MTDGAPAVALLFDDVELGAQLRDALQERGAHIVHEGGIASLSQQRLHEVAADVVVVNLDDASADAMDQWYGMLDSDRPRVVFNDAQVTRGLAGWDRDRWARHLAAKVLLSGDVDPPRPLDARELEVAAHVEPAAAATAVDGVAAADIAAAPAAATVAQVPPELPDTATTDTALEHVQRTNSESASLSAELEALLASAELSAAGEGEGESRLPLAGDGLEYPGTELDAVAATLTDAAGDKPAAEPYDFLQDVPTALSLSAAEPADDAGAEPKVTAPVAAPASWALLDDDAPASAVLPPDPDHTDSFGIEKLSAADFLAPDVAKVASNFEPVMNLELVSMEEAVAPQAIHVAVEMQLDELHMALSRLVLTGAAAAGATAAAAFFAALPATLQLTVLHVQHLDGQSAATLVGQLAAVCPLPVRLATDGSIAHPGEVLVVPANQCVHVHRDGRVELRSGTDGARESSIDDNFALGAEGFGHDALAIVFAGRGTDAVAGARAIRERGGSVWVESTATDHADMVSAVTTDGPVDFSGTPPELAARLLEVFP